MYCNYCGRENKAGVKFCAFCGKSISTLEQKQAGNIRTDRRGEDKRNFSQITENVSSNLRISATDIILGILYILTAVPWTDIFVSNYSLTETAFGLLADKEKIAMSLYILPYLFVLAIIVIGVFNIFQHKYHITLGVALIVLSVVLPIGRAVYSNVSFDPVELVGYRVFLVYEKIWIVTLISGIILTVFLYAKNVQKNRKGV